VLEQVAAGAAGTMVVFKVDIDVHPDLAQEYNVMSVPAVHVFNGGQLLAVLSGPRSKPTLLAAIAAVLG
jgi:thioredoxin 1